MRALLGGVLLAMAAGIAHGETAEVRQDRARRDVEELKRAAESARSPVERARALRRIAAVEIAAGNFLSALEYSRLAAQAAAGRPAMQLPPLYQQVNVHVLLGEVAQAQAQLEEMEGIMRELRRSQFWQEDGDDWTAIYERARARVFFGKAQYADAEQAAAASLAAAERSLASRVRAASEEKRDDVAARTESVESAASTLSSIQRTLGKLAEAEHTVRRSLQLSRARTGERSEWTVRPRRLLVSVLVERGRYAEAEREARELLGVVQEHGFTDASRQVSEARDMLGRALTMQGRWQEAVETYAQRARGLRAQGVEVAREGRFFRVMALVHTGRLDEAHALLERTIVSLDRAEGPSSFNASMARGMLGVVLQRRGESGPAMAEFRRAVPTLLERAFIEQKEDRDGPARVARLVFVLEGYMRALEVDPGSAAEMFRIADFARGSQVQRALASGAARAGVRDPALARVLGEKEALEQRIVTLSGTLSDLFNAPEDRRLRGVIEKMSQDLAEERARLARLAARIARDHPEFATIAAPRPVTLAEAQAALRPGTALVSIYLAEDRAYVWGIGAAGAAAMSVRPVTAAQFMTWVAAARKALDVGNTPLSGLSAFDLESAHRLYRELLEPVRPAWEGARTLVVIPHRALGQLPFSLLVTEPGTVEADALPFAGYRRIAWLAQRIAVAQLPAAASLVTLSRVPQARERRPFVGFGDPVFAAGQGEPGGGRAALVRNLSVARTGPGPAPQSGIPPSLSKLPALPDTREEIREIAHLLGADMEKEVFVGLAANEQRVTNQDLSRYRVIAFATHGLVPGDLEGLDQPALALSHPTLAGVGGNGLLEMDEILALKLDADWVVLSACNTASEGGGGAEALSGLGRSFFYAGARALLVSNWPVETVSARLLTTEIFRQQSADPRLSRAEALRQAMLRLMQNETAKGPDGKPLYSYAHPIFWAPFSLVGDGG